MPSTLTTAGLPPPLGFNVVEGLSASIAPGQSDTFTVRMSAFIPILVSFEVNAQGLDGVRRPQSFQD